MEFLVILIVIMLVVMVAMGLEQIANDLRRRIKYGSISVACRKCVAEGLQSISQKRSNH